MTFQTLPIAESNENYSKDQTNVDDKVQSQTFMVWSILVLGLEGFGNEINKI